MGGGGERTGRVGPVPQLSCMTLAMAFKPLFPALLVSLRKQVTDVPFLLLAVVLSFPAYGEGCGGWMGCCEQAESRGSRVPNCSWLS